MYLTRLNMMPEYQNLSKEKTKKDSYTYEFFLPHGKHNIYEPLEEKYSNFTTKITKREV